MTQTREGPPRFPRADGPLELSSLGGVDLQASSPTDAPTQVTNPRNPRAVAAVIKDLNAEYACEAAHIASVYARHFVEDMEIGDVWSAEHDMRGAVLHLREAAAQFRKWQGKPLPAREDAP